MNKEFISKSINELLKRTNSRMGFVVLIPEERKEVYSAILGMGTKDDLKNLLVGVYKLVNELSDSMENCDDDHDTKKEEPEGSDDSILNFSNNYRKLEAALQKRGYYDENGEGTKKLKKAIRSYDGGTSVKDFLNLLNRLGGYPLKKSEIKSMQKSMKKFVGFLSEQLKGDL